MNIDTLEYYEKLVAAGESPATAKAHVYALDGVFANLATKDDLRQLKIATKKDMESLRVEFKHDINNLKVEIKSEMRFVKILGGLIATAVITPLITSFFLGA